MVDVEKSSAVVWAVHCLTPKGEESKDFRNEIIWMLKMGGKAKMVDKATAFVDASASMEVMKELEDVAKEMGLDGK